MIIKRLLPVILLALAPLTAIRAALPRFPQPFGDRIVFVANGNVWSIPKSGGTAVRLTSAPGQDMFPAGLAGRPVDRVHRGEQRGHGHLGDSGRGRRRAAPDIPPGDRGRHGRPPRA
jgi:hypothetical protein